MAEKNPYKGICKGEITCHVKNKNLDMIRMIFMNLWPAPALAGVTVMLKEAGV